MTNSQIVCPAVQSAEDHTLIGSLFLASPPRRTRDFCSDKRRGPIRLRCIRRIAGEVIRAHTTHVLQEHVRTTRQGARLSERFLSPWLVVAAPEKHLERTTALTSSCRGDKVLSRIASEATTTREHTGRESFSRLSDLQRTNTTADDDWDSSALIRFPDYPASDNP